MTEEERLKVLQTLAQGHLSVGQLIIENSGTNNYYENRADGRKSESYTDEQIARAIERINGKGKAIDSKQKMAAVYWYLRWAAGWPVGVPQCCNRMSQLPFLQRLDFPCEYENIRDWAKLSFMNEDPRAIEKVRYSKNDETVFYQCREVVIALENALKKTSV